MEHPLQHPDLPAAGIAGMASTSAMNGDLSFSLPSNHISSSQIAMNGEQQQHGIERGENNGSDGLLTQHALSAAFLSAMDPAAQAPGGGGNAGIAIHHPSLLLQPDKNLQQQQQQQQQQQPQQQPLSSLTAHQHPPPATASPLEHAPAHRSLSQEPVAVCRVCGKPAEAGRPLLRFAPVPLGRYDPRGVLSASAPNVTSFEEEVCLHVFCGKTASILPHVNRPDLEILTKAGIKNKHGIGPEVNAAISRTRSAVYQEQRQVPSSSTSSSSTSSSSSSSRDKEFYLIKEFEANLALIRGTSLTALHSNDPYATWRGPHLRYLLDGRTAAIQSQVPIQQRQQHPHRQDQDSRDQGPQPREDEEDSQLQQQQESQQEQSDVSQLLHHGDSPGTGGNGGGDLLLGLHHLADSSLATATASLHHHPFSSNLGDDEAAVDDEEMDDGDDDNDNDPEEDSDGISAPAGIFNGSSSSSSKRSTARRAAAGRAVAKHPSPSAHRYGSIPQTKASAAAFAVSATTMTSTSSPASSTHSGSFLDQLPPSSHFSFTRTNSGIGGGSAATDGTVAPIAPVVALSSTSVFPSLPADLSSGSFDHLLSLSSSATTLTGGAAAEAYSGSGYDRKVRCGCGGTHLAPDTARGFASWQAHASTKRHQKWMKAQGGGGLTSSV